MNVTDQARPPSIVRVCPEMVILNNCSWPCVYAKGHAGDHRPPVEAAWCHKPLRDMDREELISTATLVFTQLETTQRDARESLARAEQWGSRVARLARYVVENTKRSSGAHDSGCWTRHARCFAFAIWGSGGLEDAERHLAGLAQPAGPGQADLLDELEAAS